LGRGGGGERAREERTWTGSGEGEGERGGVAFCAGKMPEERETSMIVTRHALAHRPLLPHSRLSPLTSHLPLP
jgi:hypothetical protein